MDVLHIAAAMRFNRSLVLLVGLALFIFIDPFVTGTLGQVALDAALILLLVLSAWALRFRGLRLAAIAMVGGATFVMIWIARDAAPALAPIALAVIAVFLAIMTTILLAYVMNMSRVTADKIFASIAAFLLLAILFATIFALIELTKPGSFAPANGAPLITWYDFLYFSVTVLTTTGFGDVVPRGAHAKAFVILEQITGVMYVAFLVARLAQLYPRRDE